MPDLSAVDLIVGAVLVLSACIGAMRGLVRELLSIVIWVVAVLGAFRYGSVVGDWLDMGGRPGTVAGFTLVFTAVFVAGALTKKLVGNLVEAVGLGGVDRTLGFLFGGVRGLLISVVALVAARPFVVGQDWWWESQARPLLEAVEEELLGWVSDYPGQPEEALSLEQRDADDQDEPEPEQQPGGILL